MRHERAGPVYGRAVQDDRTPDELRTKVFGERTIYDNQWVRLTLMDIEPPDGHRFEYHVVRLGRVAIAAVVNDADEVLMMWRHRFAVDQWGWELPGGIVDAGEDGAAAAVREIEEETGWRPTGEVRHVVSFQPMPGMVDTPHELYALRGAEKVSEPQDAEEAAIIEWVPMAKVLDLINAGEVAGSGSLVALLHLLADRAAR